MPCGLRRRPSLRALMIGIAGLGLAFAIALPRLRPGASPAANPWHLASVLAHRRMVERTKAVLRLKYRKSRSEMSGFELEASPAGRPVIRPAFLMDPDVPTGSRAGVDHYEKHPTRLYDKLCPEDLSGSPSRDLLLGLVAAEEEVMRRARDAPWDVRHRLRIHFPEREERLIDEAIRDGKDAREVVEVVRATPEILATD